MLLWVDQGKQSQTLPEARKCHDELVESGLLVQHLLADQSVPSVEI